MALSEKEKIIKNKIIKRKSVYQKFFIGLIIWEGIYIYNHRKISLRNLIVNQILKNEELNNTINNNKRKINNVNNKLATLILFKLIIFIIYRILFNKLKLMLLNNRYKNIVIKRYLRALNQAKINKNEIKNKMDIIKDDVININK